MPGPDDKLTQEEKQKAAAFISSHHPAPITCPVCGKSNWFIADHLVIPITMGDNFKILLGGGPTYPQIMLVSTDCGYTMFLNAVMVGIVPVSKSPEAEKTTPKPTESEKS